MGQKSKVKSLLALLGFRKWSAQKVYCAFVLGEITSDEVYLFLKSSQVVSFVRLHEEVKTSFNEGADRLPVEVLLPLSGMLSGRKRRFAFVLFQIDAIISRDDKRNIFRLQNTEVSHHES